MPARFQPGHATQSGPYSSAAVSSAAAAAPQAATQSPAAVSGPDQAKEVSINSIAAASPVVAPPPYGAIQGAAPAAAPVGASPDVPDPGNQGSLAAQSALPPVALGTTQGDQQHIVQVDPYAGDHWRRIAIAGAPALLPFLCSTANGSKLIFHENCYK